MRKLLLTLVCAVAMSASAQDQKLQINRESMQTTVYKQMDASRLLDVQAPKKAAADNVYYRVPEGSMWVPVNKPFYTYNTPYMVVAPWTDLTYLNMSFDKTGTWEIVTASSSIDLSDSVDEEGNLNYGSYTGGAGGYYAPQYTAGDITYVPSNTKAGNAMIVSIDDVQLHTFVPVGVNGMKIYSGGSLDNGNLYGAGKLTYSDGATGTALGVIYTTPKPMNDLYVENVYVWGMLRDLEADVLPEGTSLVMTIYNLEDEDAEPIELTCSADDITEVEVLEDEVRTLNMVFSKKVLDEASGELVDEPFVLNYPAEIHILGFDQEGVMIGMPGCEQPDEFLIEDDEEGNKSDLNQAYFAVRNDETGNVRYHYYTGCVPMVAFQSMYEVIDVVKEAQSQSGETFGNVNAMVVSEDGQDCGNHVFTNIEGVEVYTALDWEDETSGEELYWSDDMYDYDWIQNLTATQVTYTSGNPIGGAYYVGAVCDALPAGVEGRYAKIHLNGRGVVSDPIFIFQGNVDIDAVMEAEQEDAINGVIATAKSSKTYNMMGQEVNKSFKGLVIRNGKKYFVK